MLEAMKARAPSCLQRAEESRPAAGPAQRQRSTADFLGTLFRALDENRVCYCVLHSWETVPVELPSDLDLAVRPCDRNKLAFVFRMLLDKGYRPVQCLSYAVKSYRFDFVWDEYPTVKAASIDITFRYSEGGLFLFSGEALVKGRRKQGGFWRAAPDVEFSYLLARRVLKGSLSDCQAGELKRLVEELGRPEAERVAGKLFGEPWKKEVVDACTGGRMAGLLSRLKRAIWVTALTRDPSNPLRRFLGDGLRLIGRWFQPTGILVVVLGPDGVGKSTLVAELIENLRPLFRRWRTFHWRPQLIAPQKQSGNAATAPHAEPTRGTLDSVARLFLFLLDYWLGYLFLLRPFLARTGLIVFDRYFHDIFIDPRRYRYGGPLWLPRLLAPFVPPPDLLFLVLDAEEEVILARKQEVTPDDLHRLRAAYAQLPGNFAGARFVRTDSGLQESLLDATRTIANYMVERFERRHPSWLASS
jgi:thymidylate kinase